MGQTAAPASSCLARAAIDHLAIGPRGITVIDAVRERGRARVVDGGPGRRSSSASTRGPSSRTPFRERLRVRGSPLGSTQQMAPPIGSRGDVARPRRITVRNFAALLDRRLPPRD